MRCGGALQDRGAQQGGDKRAGAARAPEARARPSRPFPPRPALASLWLKAKEYLLEPRLNAQIETQNVWVFKS